MPTTIFRPTSPTIQNRPKMKISNFCVFCPIWIKFGIWANNGPKITRYKFEMATATVYASTETPLIPSRTIILSRFLKVVSGDLVSCLKQFHGTMISIVDRFFLAHQRSASQESVALLTAFANPNHASMIQVNKAHKANDASS